MRLWGETLERDFGERLWVETFGRDFWERLLGETFGEDIPYKASKMSLPLSNIIKKYPGLVGAIKAGV